MERSNIKLIRRGRYSYAIPVTKAELKALGINDPENDKLHLTATDAYLDHKLKVELQTQYEDRVNNGGALGQIFNNWFKENHIAPEDQAEYLEKAYDEMRKENGGTLELR